MFKGSNIQYIHITFGHYFFFFKFSFIPGLNREIIKIKVEQWSHIKKICATELNYKGLFTYSFL